MALTDEDEILKAANATGDLTGAGGTGLGAAGANPASALNGSGGLGAGLAPQARGVNEILGDITSQDSPLMKQAAASGRQFANRRGLLNSSLAAQASQAAVIDRAAPIASQEADIQFRREALGREQEFQTTQNELERQNRIVLAQMNLTGEDRRGAEATLANAFRDYEYSLQSILENPKLPAAERNKLLSNARAMLQAKIDFTSDLLSTAFDWPENPFVVPEPARGGTGVFGKKKDTSPDRNLNLDR